MRDVRTMWALAALAGAAACQTGTEYGNVRQFEFSGPTRPAGEVTIEGAKALAMSTLRPGETLESAKPIFFPGLGEWYVVSVAETSNDSRGFAVDVTGKTIAEETLRDAERRAAYKRFGRMTPTLYSEQEMLSADDEIRVGIVVRGDWLAEADEAFEPPADVRRLPLEEQRKVWEERHRIHLEHQRERLSAAKQPVLALLRKYGITEAQPLENIPVIDVRIPVALLRSQDINENTSVVEMDTIEPPQPPHKLGFAAHYSMNEQYLFGGQCGSAAHCDGAGVSLGIWETGCYGGASEVCAGIDSGNTRLPDSAHHIYNYMKAPTSCTTLADCNNAQSDYVCELGKCVDSHLTYVAGAFGMVGSYQYDGNGVIPPASGNAPATDVFSNNGVFNVSYNVANSQNLVSNANWIVGSATFVTHSEDSFAATAAAATNWAARYDGLMYVQAAGNVGSVQQVCQNYVSNGLCVGYYKYMTYNDLTTHRRSANSSYLNGPAMVERPHLLGPGTYTDNNSMFLPRELTTGAGTLTVGPSGTGTSGSSFAAPIVLSAEVQTLMYAGFFSPISYQLPMKAIMLAGARDANADGPIGKGTKWSEQPSDAEDGAGQIDLASVKQLVDLNQVVWLSNLNDTNFVSCGTGCREYTVATLPINLGGTAVNYRISMAYNACTTSSDGLPDMATDALLNNDLDLVFQRGGSRSCSGTFISDDNLGEVELLSVPIVRNCGGTIKIRIKNGATLNHCGASAAEPTAVAWSYQG